MKELNTTEVEILATFERILPKLNDDQKLRLLYFSEGMAFMKDQQDGGEPPRCNQQPA